MHAPKIERPRERYAISKLLVTLSRLLRASAKPSLKPDCDDILVACSVLVGHVEGRPMNATKISHYVGMPRSTVLRRLDRLMKGDIVVRRGNIFQLSANRVPAPVQTDRALRLIKDTASKLGAATA